MRTKQMNSMIILLVLGMAFGLAGSAQAENIILTFSDLSDEGGEGSIADDYQPSELAETGITTTWTSWSLFNDDITGEGLRDHTETWDPGAPTVYVYTSDEGGSIAFSSAVEVPSIWIYQDSWAATAVAGYLGDQEIWSVPAEHPEAWVEITEGAGYAIDSIVAVGGLSMISPSWNRPMPTKSAFVSKPGSPSTQQEWPFSSPHM